MTNAWREGQSGGTLGCNIRFLPLSSSSKWQKSTEVTLYSQLFGSSHSREAGACLNNILQKVDRARNHPAKQSEPNPERQISHDFSYKWNLDSATHTCMHINTHLHTHTRACTHKPKGKKGEGKHLWTGGRRWLGRGQM